MSELKPGNKTSECWLSAIFQLAVSFGPLIAYAFGVPVPVEVIMAGFGAGAAANGAYSVSRGLAKKKSS